MKESSGGRVYQLPREAYVGNKATLGIIQYDIRQVTPLGKYTS